MENDYIEFWFLKFDGYGTLADWFGIVATIVTIILTIKHFNKVNGVQAHIYAKEISKDDKRFVEFSYHNIGQTPVKVAFECFKSFSEHMNQYPINPAQSQYINSPRGIQRSELVKNVEDSLNKAVCVEDSEFKIINNLESGCQILLEVSKLKEAKDVDIYIRYREFGGTLIARKVSKVLREYKIKV